MDESASKRRSLSRREKPAGNWAIPGQHADGWRRNGWKSSWNNQGDPPVLVSAIGKESAYSTGGSQSVRSSGEAGNDRGAKGRRKVEVRRTERRTKRPTRVPARASQWWNQPSTIDLGDTERLIAALGDEAKNRSLSQEYPLTGKPDAGEPPVRFGGRGGGHPLSLPLSQNPTASSGLDHSSRLAGYFAWLT